MIRHWKPLWYLLVGLGLIVLLAACDVQVPESVPTRISEVRPERPTAEQPVPEAPAPEQPAPEQPAPEQPAEPTAEQPAPQQPTAPPAPLEPIPTPPAQPDDTRLLDTLLILLVLAIIVVVFFLGRTLGRERQERRAAAMAAQAPQPAPVQNTFNMAPVAPPPPLPVTPPPPPPVAPIQPVDAQRRFVYYPGTDTIPVQDTPPIYDRSHTITIDLLRNAVEEEGVLLALGSMQAGYAVYVQNQRLIYTLALGAVTKQIIANAAMPLGQVRVRFEFNRTGAFRGTGALFINEQLVGAQIFANTIPLPPGEGLDIGIDRGIPVTSDYPAPFPYAGSVQSVVYELTFDSAADQA
jgi:hypothetical protein